MRLWAWVQQHHPHLSRGRVRSLVNECLLHHAAQGNRHGYSRWWQVCARWIEKDERWRNERREARPELPQEAGPRDSDLAPIIDLAQRRRMS